MVGDEAVDVAVARPELGHGSRLRLREGEIARAHLIAFGRPVVREVAVQIEAVAHGGHLYFVPIPVVDGAFGDDAVIDASELVRFAAAHYAWVFLRRFPS